MKKPKRGGKRPGAGRKPGKKRVLRTFSLSQESLAYLETLAEARGVAPGRIIDKMVQNQIEPENQQ